jgi:hypothetical protein
MNGRDASGRFVAGNPWASSGGQARAERLTPERRREIAAAGWAGFVARRFGGDPEAARAWLGQLGAWASDAPYRATFPIFQDPGACPGVEVIP